MVEALAPALVSEPVALAMMPGSLELPPPDAADVWLMQLEGCAAVDTARAAARRATRTVLARYLDTSPATLRFERGVFGKPELHGSPLSFSVAHRPGLALLAVAAGGRIGVDLERRRPLPELDGIAAMLHPAERTLLAQVPAHRRADLFYRLWTRKEAALKAVGTGLALGLDRVSVVDDHALVPLAGSSRRGAPASLSLHDIALGPAWAAALAGEAGCREPRVLALQEAGR